MNQVKVLVGTDLEEIARVVVPSDGGFVGMAFPFGGNLTMRWATRDGMICVELKQDSAAGAAYVPIGVFPTREAPKPRCHVHDCEFTGATCPACLGEAGKANEGVLARMMSEYVDVQKIEDGDHVPVDRL